MEIVVMALFRLALFLYLEDKVVQTTQALPWLVARHPIYSRGRRRSRGWVI